jgi:predicted HicB family RNase H-like nuclease
MAKRKLSISNLRNIPTDIAKEAAKAMEGEETVVEKTEKQNNIKTEIETKTTRKRTPKKVAKVEARKDNITYKTVRINKDLHYRLKVKALEQQMKMTDFIEYLLERGIK